ncbi:MAG: hypothetical protein HFE90_03490 [Firmicutes bacterium]|nr:hypothetical protein [Bacillota bacterium]
MSFIISQTGVGRLPTELVKNAAFIKHIDFDPVHQTDETDQYAEKISGNSSRFDKISISAEALANAKDILFSDSKEDISQQQESSVIDITDPAYIESKKQGDALSRAMNSWKNAVEHLKQISESSRDYDYSKTMKLFKNSYADWQNELKNSDPDAYGAWIRMLERN